MSGFIELALSAQRSVGQSGRFAFADGLNNPAATGPLAR
jgi:hypothetical protein